ncbi:MAG: hypothetical protein DI498_04455 [Paracoccus denitrificans]|nr:MAG: hypothetical protein DI498_04455 [Paracoccus denitrificans]PZO85188.1 MAG: hypothetical protein DI633_04455 [Paracoccus denitrificans]
MAGHTRRAVRAGGVAILYRSGRSARSGGLASSFGKKSLPDWRRSGRFDGMDTDPHPSDTHDPPPTAGVLRRYIAAQQRTVQDRQAGVQPPRDRAVSMAVSRAAQKVHRLAVFVDRAESRQISLAELPELLPDHALLLLVEDQSGRLGVAALSSGLVGAIIEMQTLGRLAVRGQPRRRATRTDAAIAADFVNAVLADLPAEAGIGWRQLSFVADPRPLCLLLDDQPHSHDMLSLRLGETGERNGALHLVLPVAEPAPVDAAQIPAADNMPLTQPLGDCPLPMVGILARHKLRLGALRRLAPGDLIPLPRASLDQARLETASGQLVAMGRLGQSDGYHALRVGTGPEAERADAPSKPVMADIGDLDDPDPFRPSGSGSVIELAG